jgi:hypothetical protein
MGQNPAAAKKSIPKDEEGDIKPARSNSGGFFFARKIAEISPVPECFPSDAGDGPCRRARSFIIQAQAMRSKHSRRSTMKYIASRLIHQLNMSYTNWKADTCRIGGYSEIVSSSL